MSSRERNLLIILGVIVLAAGGFFLLTMGGEEQPPEQAAPAPSPPAVVEPGPGAEQPGNAPRAFTFFGGRDPFVPLVVEPTETAPTDGTGTEPTPTEPPTEPVEEAPPGAEEQQAGSVTMGGKTVTLIDVVDSDTAQVEVDGQTYRVSEGEEFAQNFELVSVTGTCARFLFGDESFTLCEGEAPK